MTLASVFPTRGTWKSEKLTFSKASANKSLAGFNKAVWKGPDTLSGINLFTPASCKSSTALSTASASPPITIWLGVL